jgi:hypothetical protein
MSDVISKLMEANLLAVFDERDPQRRAETIAKIYSSDVEWIDDEGTTVGREALQAKGLHFTKASPVHRTRGLGFLAWELRSSDDATVATGFDVAEIADDLIARLWTVMTSE